MTRRPKKREDGHKDLGLDYFIHPLPLGAVAVLIFNDHYLKRAHPSWLTGKLSDLAGLFFFPLFLCALAKLILGFKRGAAAPLTAPQLLTAIALTDVGFVALKLSPSFAKTYVTTLAGLGFPSRVTADASDLIALAASFATWAFARRFLRAS